MSRRIKQKFLLLTVLVSLFLSPLAPVLAQSESVDSNNSSEQSLPDADNLSSEMPADPAGIFVDENQPDDAGDDLAEPANQIQDEEKTPLTYSEAMRSLAQYRAGIDENGQPLADSVKEQLKNFLLESWPDFIASEQEKLSALGVSEEKSRDYFNYLESRRQELAGETSTWQKVKGFLSDLLSPLTSELEQADVKIPDNPGNFDFIDEPSRVASMSDIFIGHQSNRVSSRFSAPLAPGAPLPDQLIDYPKLADVREDSGEIIINDEIKALALALNNNPVKIYNFVRNNISYEPYYGAKKGSAGCLAERVCNDVDAASLTIALLRAGGIPARYHKQLISVSTRRLREFLGVSDNKNAYAGLAGNGIPIFTIAGQNLGGSLDEVDLSQASHFLMEWVWPQMFYEYDERAGNFSNILDLGALQSDADLQNVLAAFPKKQWVFLDPVLRAYNYEQAEIVSDTANFDAENFWYDYLRYSGNLSPIDKYASDLQSAAGKDIKNPAFQSSRSNIAKDYEILPPVLPYLLESASEIQPENWSQLPDSRRRQVVVELLDGSTPVLSHTFWGNEINNQDLNLYYRGATDTDQSIIEQYGGIAYAPAALVNIKAILEADNSVLAQSFALTIGKNLILRFTLKEKGETTHISEKFSIAGNDEGIVISLSKTMPDALAQTPSQILAKGNVGIAREYLNKIEAAGALLQSSLDHRAVNHFTRAVVTQNRVLNSIDGLPTTFDFKGLSLDASTLTNDYSNRGNYKDHRKDIRLIFALNASYQEAQIFTDIAGLDGISTVRGLQYAYSRPQDYTVHKITPANEALIDTLSLSENTKQNMHSDVQAGNAIITPNRVVTSGSWSGIFYISLAPNWTGTYAIGEQTQQNGGYTTNQLLRIVYINQTDSQRYGFLRQFGNNERFYQEDRTSDQVLCRIGSVEYDLVTNSADWRSSYGFPCNIGSVQFGDIDHAYIHASNASKFTSLGRYDYWEYLNNIQTKINNYISVKKNLPSSHINYLESGQKFSFRFSTVLGTYLQSICETKSGLSGLFGRCGDEATIYYAPNQSGGDIYRARGDILSKLSKDDNRVVKLLGWPTSDEAGAAPSREISDGQYQNFVNGQIYKYKSWLVLTKTHYTYGKLTEEHNNQNGTGGLLGFPTADPVAYNNGVIYQSFENDKEIKWNASSNIVQAIDFVKFRCEIYGGTQRQNLIDKYRAVGVADTLKDTVEDLYSLAVFLIGNIGHIDQAVMEIIEAAKNFNPRSALSLIGDVLVGEVVDAGSELDQAINDPNGCKARISYLEGRFYGILATYAVPASKLKAATKLKAASRLIKYVPTGRLGKSIIKKFPLGQRTFDNWEIKGGDWKPNAHHVIPQSFRNHQDYGQLIGQLDNLWGGPGKFDLNDGLNGLVLPNKLHPGSHLTTYNEQVYSRLNGVVGQGKERVESEIKRIRNEILDGKLKPNTSWDEPSSKEFLEAVRNTKNIYQ